VFVSGGCRNELPNFSVDARRWGFSCQEKLLPGAGCFANHQPCCHGQCYAYESVDSPRCLEQNVPRYWHFVRDSGNIEGGRAR
jgi:hypothetical protein